MIYELRTYWVDPGRLGEFIDNQASLIKDVVEKYGFEYVGYWTVSKPSPEDGADLVYLLRWASMDARNDSWKHFWTYPEWLARLAEANFGGTLLLADTSAFLQPTAFSKLQ